MKFMRTYFRYCLAVLLLVQRTQAIRHKYNTAAARVEGKLNVHIVCHTHDDSGWLKTVDQYYYGARNEIQVAGVQYILDTVIEELQQNKDRKFVYAEMSFFTMWWAEQDEETREVVKSLVKSGQLDFVNGGYVQHDEAAAHYVAMIDQTTRGHRFLNATFGKVPRVGWQLDPFGHSATQAALMSAVVGFDGLFFGRADYQDMEARKLTKDLEVLWRGAASFGENADIFTGNFASGNYGPPPGFNWDWASWGADPPMMDDPALTDYNVEQRLAEFLVQVEQIAAVTAGNDIMLTMGSDFQYANARTWYKNLDKLIHYANLDGRLNLFYSTPAEYIAAKHAYNATWSVKTDDFFPYADCPVCYWTGYFTSRPTSKGYIRSATSYLQAARQLEVLAGLKPQGPNTDSLEKAVSLTQHHDSITGTEKQHVANDYHMRLARGWTEAEAVVLGSLSDLISTPAPAHPIPLSPSELSPWILPATAANAAIASIRRILSGTSDDSPSTSAAVGSAAAQDPAPTPSPPPLAHCRLLNVSICQQSVDLTGAGSAVSVVAYNPLAWPRKEGVRVPISGAWSSAVAWVVLDSDGNEVPSQAIPVSAATQTLQETLESGPEESASALQELAFIADVPALGYSVYTISPATATSGSATLSTTRTINATESLMAGKPNQILTLSNGVLELGFSEVSGLLVSLRNVESGVSAALTHSIFWYNSSDALSGGLYGTPSGAYIFRPNGEFEPAEPPNVILVQGPLLTEIRQVFSEWATLVTRVWQGQDHLEVEWTVGPIPVEDGLGKEVVLRLTSDLQSGSEWFTDSNGREMLRRRRNFRPTWNLTVIEPISGNYYPLTAAMYLEEPERAQLAVLTERAQGGASMASGELEVMVHRRTLLDDWRGVGEPINETEANCLNCNSPGLVARGTHYVTLQAPGSAARVRRTLQQRLNDPLVLAFGPVAAAPSAAGRGRFSALQDPVGLPPNVHLLTFQALPDGSVLLRLAHLYQVNEDAVLSLPAVVNLGAVFNGVKAEEVSLSTNQLRADMRRLQWSAGRLLSGESPIPVDFQPSAPIQCREGCAGSDLDVILNPMEIRTFILVPQ